MTKVRAVRMEPKRNAVFGAPTGKVLLTAGFGGAVGGAEGARSGPCSCPLARIAGLISEGPSTSRVSVVASLERLSKVRIYDLCDSLVGDRLVGDRLGRPTTSPDAAHRRRGKD